MRLPKHCRTPVWLLATWLLSAALFASEPWWSLQPLRRPELPQDSKGCRNEIDQFISAKLKAAGMGFSPAADKRTLLRRVYYDLIGLPPTPREVESFLSDGSPNAYEHVVDELLNSPRYG